MSRIGQLLRLPVATRSGFFASASVLVLVLCICYRYVSFYAVDEAMIVEFGRAFLHGYGPNVQLWEWRQPHGLQVPFFIGPVANELLVRPFSDGALAGRYVALFWVVLAAFSSRAFLLARRSPQFLANLAGLAMLVDPLLHWGARFGRVDALAIAVCFLGLSAMWNRAERSVSDFYRGCLLAGFAIGLAPFVWPTAIIFALLAAQEASLCILRFHSSAPKVFARALVAGLLGALASAGTLALLICIKRPDALIGMQQMSAYESRNGVALGAVLLIASWLMHSSPALAATAGTAMLGAEKRFWLLAPLAMAVLVLVASTVSGGRLAYVYPFMIAAIGQSIAERPVGPISRIVGAGLALSVVLGAGITCGLYAVNGWLSQSDFGLRELDSAVSVIERSNCRAVLDTTGSGYFALRSAHIPSISSIAFSADKGRGLGYEAARFDELGGYLRALTNRFHPCAVLVDRGGSSHGAPLWKDQDTVVLKELGYCPLLRQEQSTFARTGEKGIDAFAFGGGPTPGPYSVYLSCDPSDLSHAPVSL